MAVPGGIVQSMDRIFARIVEAEEQEGITCYYGSESWGDGAESQITHVLANLRSQPASPQRAVVERMVLSTAIKKFAPARAKSIIEATISIPKAEADLNFAMSVAANCGNVAILKLLLEKGADHDCRDRDGQTTLMIVAKAGHEVAVKLLLEKSADPNFMDEDGQTALMIAAKAGHEVVVKLLLEEGARPNFIDEDGQTALIIAAKAGHEAVIKLLLEKGAHPNYMDGDGQNALIIAAKAGHEAVIKLLLEKSADPNFMDEYGQTALIIAAKAGHEAAVKLLLEKSADPNFMNGDRQTALMIAAKAGHEVVVKLLLEEGARPNFIDEDGQTALMIATKAGHEAIVNLLLGKGAHNSRKPAESIKQHRLELKSGRIQPLEHNRGYVFKYPNQPSAVLTEKQISGSELIEAARQGHDYFDAQILRTPLSQYGKGILSNVLIEAAKQGHEKVVTRLLEEPTFRFRVRQLLRDALIEAAKQGHEKVVARLLEVPTFRFRARRILSNALIEAAKQGHEKVVSQLLKELRFRFHVSRVCADALIEAAKRGHEKVVKCFREYRNRYSIKATVIVRCLFTAVQNGHTEVVDALLALIEKSRLAIIVNNFDDEGRTPLHWAVERGDEKIVMLLIEAGSSVAFLDSCGMSALQLAAISGVTPLELDSSRKYLAEKNSPADAKTELGLGFGESHLMRAAQVILKSSDAGDISPYDGQFSLYDFILHGVARSLGSLTPFEILSDPKYRSQLRSWGSSLVGGHVRFAIGYNTSVIVRLDRLFGFGSELDGRTFLHTLIAFEESINGETNRFRLRQLMRASSPKHHVNLRRHQLLIWFVGLAHSASKHQEKRARDIQSKKVNSISAGSCWRDAFGDVPEVDLHEYFNTPNAIRLNPTFWPQTTDNQSRFSNDLTFSTIEDLASALGIYSETTVDGMLFWKGHRGICVLVGVLPHANIPFWHVCTIEQSSYLEADPQNFVRGIKSNRDSILEVNSKPQALCDCSQVTSFQGTILVGALVEPSWCEKVDCDGLFQAEGENIQSGRLAPEDRRQGLQWSNISGQLQLGMGAQGPQGSVTVGGELARNGGRELLMAENSLAQGLTTLERALRSWVLVYQSFNGQVTQQNLYCIVSCFLMNETSEIIFHQESRTVTEPAKEWCDRRVTLIRVCSTIIAAPMPAFLNGKMGGLDLAAIVKECARIWVWESPSSHLGWVTVLGTLPAVSVRSLGEAPRRPSLQRCTLFISVGRLEQIVGRLYRVEALKLTFESEMVRIKLRGFNDASLKEAQRAAILAKTLRWTESVKAVMPGRRFGGQGPSSMEHVASTRIWDYVLLLANRARDCGYRTGCVTLGNIANGTELTGDSVGLLIECV